MERIKFSLLTDDLETCYLCGKPATDKHHVFGGYSTGNRDHSEDDGLVVPLCWNCHRKVHNQPSQQLMYSLKKQGQLAWEEAHPGESFAKRYGKNYV